MNRFELIVPCHFGMEAVCKKEILDMGYEVDKVEDGRVTFTGDAEAICRANICLRTAERVLLKVGSFTARTFEELSGKSISLLTESSGSRKPPLLKVSSSVHPIFSPL